MLAGVVAVYCPPALFSGDAALYGADFWTLHLHRLDFVREQLSWSSWTLPGWYPRELLGTPFWSNLQNFPWIPTRLALLPIDPVFAYPLGVNLAAALAALFTYLYGRSIGWGPAAAALAGWTFACGGFFAARVTVGHLPLLEAYPALPLLLWLVERTHRSGKRAKPLAGLALGSACVVVAGHPQLPAYAVASALLYLFWIGAPGNRLRSACAIALGVGSTLFVWWPMLKLLQRSTRLLSLARADNDLALPYSRLGAFFLPWKDGWPSIVQRTPVDLFRGFPSAAYFWDTVAYVGILPWLAALGLLVALIWRRSWPRPRATFFATLGLAGLLLALPFAQDLTALVPGTFLRSPARLLYLTTFALSLAVGSALQAALRAPGPLPALLAAIAVLAHGIDLASHDRSFIRLRSQEPYPMTRTEQFLAEHLGSARVAMDYDSMRRFNRRYDDVGFFDSILLAAPYRALLGLSGKPPDTNVQALSGGSLPGRALSNLGVRFVITSRRRSDLPYLGSEGYHLYYIPNATPRAAFLSRRRVRFLSEEDMLARLGDDALHLRRELMLPLELEGTPADEEPSPKAAAEPAIEYRRPSPDRIVLEFDAPRAGYIRVLESWDPGWRASLDGDPIPVLRADTFTIALAVGPGRHRVELVFETPGARAGAAASLASLLLLAALLRAEARAGAGGPRAGERDADLEAATGDRGGSPD